MMQSMIEHTVIPRIAQKIRMTRLKKELTVQQLADRANVSKGLLSKIENSRTLPSLPVFVSLVQALEVSLKEFFEDMLLINGKNYLLVRKEQYTVLEKEGRPGFHYRHILSQNISGATMEAVLLTLHAGAKGQATTTDGYELKYIISGTCEYHINEEVIPLREGDTLYFVATMPHLPVNNSSTDVVMLVIYLLLPKSD